MSYIFGGLERGGDGCNVLGERGDRLQEKRILAALLDGRVASDGFRRMKTKHLETGRAQSSERERDADEIGAAARRLHTFR